MTKVNPIIQWWMTKKLPYEDIYSGYEKKATGPIDYIKRMISMWVAHPIKRRLARIYLKLLQAFTGIKVIGITGSSGKTTTTEMLASILRKKGKTVWSKESVDAIYNIPNTILRTGWGTKYLILEMSVEYPGEMDYYLWLAKPDIGVILNIFPTHTEFFGDTGGVFREKSKLVKSLPLAGTAILNAADKFLVSLKDKLKSNMIWFGNGTEVMSSQEFIRNLRTEFLLILNQDKNSTIKITLPIAGKQFITSALAAASVAKTLGFSLEDIKTGLESFTSAKHRMNIIKHSSGSLIIDDSYNSNPKSATETINSFDYLAGSRDKVVVFGDMLELGTWEEKYHKEVGHLLGKSHLKKLICVGEAVEVTAKEASKLMGENSVTVVSNYKKATEELRPYLKKNVAVLVKGSRSIHLEHLIEAIK